MKIRYCKSVIRNNYGYGFTMIGLGIFAVYINSSSVFSYLWIFLGILQAGTSYYRQKYQYLTIKENRLIRHSIIPKSIALSDIRRVKRYMNSYKIETHNQSLRIEKEFIETESLQRLNLFLKDFKPQVSTHLR
ncbi:hypothetical protein JRG66_14025 [Salinimicrobium tongyeongense]|uniref:PH domain-containing protein n=1 Tax=Salinimicrobium tongyeongense TaxID=2809707 RepID=A0ABY6NQX6_9FLAO|nr:hypothetical protein [Salinimicrobium tongyeongense]UZH55061.1 hypothetical protein JRG66_14025 [Salinimicrobium tongyeongense]